MAATWVRIIRLESFAVGGHNWRLRYYPDGSTEDSKDDIAVVLELLVGMGMKVDQVRVSCNMSFLDWRAKRFCTSFSAFTENLSHPDYLVSHTMDRGEMEPSGYVVDDRLIIRCVLTVINEPYVFADGGSHVEVPPSDITEQLRKLLQAKEGADVVFEVQGEEFPAHKLVIATRSPVFKASLYGPMREKDSNRFVVDDMQPAIFKVLLHFIYTDSLPAMDNDLEGDDKKEVTRYLLVAADRYAMERLKLMRESILCKELDVESVATVLGLADRHSCSKLKDACIRFIASSTTKIDDVVASRGYIQLKRTCPDTVMEMW